MKKKDFTLFKKGLIQRTNNVLEEMLKNNSITEQDATIILKTVVDAIPNKFVDESTTIVDIREVEDTNDWSDNEKNLEEIKSIHCKKYIQYVRRYGNGIAVTQNKQANKTLLRISRDNFNTTYNIVLDYIRSLYGYKDNDLSFFYLTRAAVKKILLDLELKDLLVDVYVLNNESVDVKYSISYLDVKKV